MKLITDIINKNICVWDFKRQKLESWEIHRIKSLLYSRVLNDSCGSSEAFTSALPNSVSELIMAPEITKNGLGEQ